MRIRITKLSDWELENRDVCLGQEFDVFQMSVTGGFMGYMVWCGKRSLLVYEYECEIIDCM